MNTETAANAAMNRAATAARKPEARQHIKALEVEIVRRIENQDHGAPFPPAAVDRIRATAELTGTTRDLWHLAEAADKGAPVWPRNPETPEQWEATRETLEHLGRLNRITSGYDGWANDRAQIGRAIAAGRQPDAETVGRIDAAREHAAGDREHAAIVAALKSPELARELGRACASVARHAVDLNRSMFPDIVTPAKVRVLLAAWAPFAGDSVILDPLARVISKMADTYRMGGTSRPGVGEAYGHLAMRAIVKAAKR